MLQKGWKEHIFCNQNRQIPLDQPPQRHLPRWGRWLETARLIVICLPAGQLQANITAPFDLVTTRFELGEGIAAFDTERLKPYRAEPGGFDLIPRSSTYRSVETMGGPAIVLAFKQPLRESLVAHQLGYTRQLAPGQIQPTASGFAIANAIHALITGDTGDAFHLESLANLTLGHVLHRRVGSKNCRKRRPDRLQPEQLNRVLTYIRHHLGDQLCLEQLASTVELSANYFAHAFKATTGVSPHQYVLYCRVQYAQNLLTRTDDSLADIAYAAGFGSQSHMTAVFSRTLKMTPQRCRQQALSP